jgi:hypothetical protein
MSHETTITTKKKTTIKFEAQYLTNQMLDDEIKDKKHWFFFKKKTGGMKLKYLGWNLSGKIKSVCFCGCFCFWSKPQQNYV